MPRRVEGGKTVEIDRRLTAILMALQRIASSAGECSVIHRADFKVLCVVQSVQNVKVIRQHFEQLAEMRLIEILDTDNDPKNGWTVKVLDQFDSVSTDPIGA